MDESVSYYHRRLPHYQPSVGTYFVTFRLVDSLPKEVVLRLKEEQEAQEKILSKIENERSEKTAISRKRYFGKFDGFLDGSTKGSLWLGDPRIADLTACAIRYRDPDKYDLRSYCIMPNHVHMVFTIGENHEAPVPSGAQHYIVTSILQSLKVHVALEANKILGRSGAFWQRESYDHIVRNEQEFNRVVKYVLDNPVKAGLVERWEEWKWNYVKM